MLPEFQKLIDSAVKGEAFFKPTDIFDEGFLLKILFQFAIENPGVSYNNDKVDLVMSHPPDTKFFCEGQLYTRFNYHLDSDLYETDTHADGIIGHFTIQEGTKTRIIANPDARQFVVIEAKLNARLKKGVKNAPTYDQAARNIACIAETLFDASLKPTKLDRIGFYVLAPEQKISKGIFNDPLTKESVDERVRERINLYKVEQKKELNQWYNHWFRPTLKHIGIELISWEEIIDSIIRIFPDRTDLESFYQHCKKYNDLNFEK